MTRLGPRTLALYAILVFAAFLYRVPLHPLHRAILMGLGVYLTVHTMALTYMAWHQGEPWARDRSALFETAGYSLTLSWWAWAAWRPERPPNPVIAMLHPWAHTW